MTIETYLLHLAALAIFFATPPDTSQLLIIANSARHGLKKSGWTIVGDLTAKILQMSAPRGFTPGYGLVGLSRLAKNRQRSASGTWSFA